MKNFFVVLALFAIAIFNGVQSENCKGDFPASKPTRDYSKEDMIQRSVVSLLDKSYPCVTSCVESVIENVKRAKAMETITSKDIDRICDRSENVEPCALKCSGGLAKTAVMILLPLYEIVCSEWKKLKKEHNYIISSVDCPISKFFNCSNLQHSPGKNTALQFNNFTDFIQTVKNDPQRIWDFTQCYIDRFQRALKESKCNKALTAFKLMISKQLDRTRCDILDQFGVSKKEAPKVCNSCVKADTTSLTGLVFMFLLVKVFK